MAAVDFHYTLSTADLDAFREEGIRRFGILKRKGFESKLTPEQMYSLLYQPIGRILCIITVDGEVRGMAVLVEVEDIFAGTKSLLIEATQLDNVPGLLDTVATEWDRLAEMDGYDSVRFVFTRRGWAKKMKMEPEKGYNVVMSIAEKRYGR